MFLKSATATWVQLLESSVLYAAASRASRSSAACSDGIWESTMVFEPILKNGIAQAARSDCVCTHDASRP